MPIPTALAVCRTSGAAHTMRDEVAQSIPLFGFYRDLLAMLFRDGDASFECDPASVVVR